MKFQSGQDIFEACQSGVKEAIVCLDNQTAPPTYGDYLMVVMFARYLITRNIKTTFYIVDSEYRYDWNVFDSVQISNFVSEQGEIANLILNKPVEEVGYKIVDYRGTVIEDTTTLLNEGMKEEERRLEDYLIFVVDDLEMFRKIEELIDRSSMRGCNWKVKYSPKTEVKIVNWEQMKGIFSSINTDEVFIPFIDSVTERGLIYHMCFNVLNYLVAQEDDKFRNQFLLSFNEFVGRVEFTKPDFPYIVWHCRHTSLWGLERNTSDGEFLNISNSLKTLFPNHKIMVVSDSIGCSYFRELAQRNGIDLIYSKDYSPTFLGDTALVLGSDYYFSLRGGGIVVPIFFSQVPYEYIGHTGHQNEWTTRKLSSWSTEKQSIIKLSADDMNLYLPTNYSKE